MLLFNNRYKIPWISAKQHAANRTDNVYFAIFAITLLFNVYYSFICINNYILDLYALRQTQTAITAWYFVKDGFKLAYDTPIAGAPWSMPYEFPIYQGIVALCKNIFSGVSLDVIGRIISLLFFYSSLFLVYKLIFLYTKSHYQSLFALSFVLIHPVYIFWSRTFMIESTALFFGLFYLYSGLVFLNNKKIIYLLLTEIGGLAGGLVKITTFLPIAILLFVIALWHCYHEKVFRSGVKVIITYLFYGIIIFVIPIVTVKFWVDFSDDLKNLSTCAKEFTSVKLHDWNFGTMSQKLSWHTWTEIFRRSQVSHPFFYVMTVGLLIFIVKKKYKYWQQAVCSLALYIIAPVIFTNLHFVHDYYTYANSLFLCLCIAFIALSLTERLNIYIRLTGFGLAVGVLLFFASRYLDNYYSIQTKPTDFLYTLAGFVKLSTDPDDVVMVHGTDCSAEFPYYMERRSIALPNSIKSVNDKRFKDIIEENKDYKITALVVVTQRHLVDTAFTGELIDYMGFTPILHRGPIYVFKKIDK